jgi:hypothetical protein
MIQTFFRIRFGLCKMHLNKTLAKMEGALCRLNYAVAMKENTSTEEAEHEEERTTESEDDPSEESTGG